MTFTIHVTHRHTEGAGLDNEHYDREVECDDDITVEVDEATVHSDIVEMIYQDYFAQDYARLVESENRDEARREAKASIERMLDEFDAWAVPTEIYHEELRDKYEAEHDD